MTTLSDAQLRFLRLHARYLVWRWKWLFQDTSLRAYANKHSATIWREELLDLIGFGFMEPGHGYADVKITAAGRAAAEEKELA